MGPITFAPCCFRIFFTVTVTVMRPKRGCKKARLEAGSEEEDEAERESPPSKEREQLKDSVQKLPCDQGGGSLPTKNSVEDVKRQLEEERKQLKEELKKVEFMKNEVEIEKVKVRLEKAKVEVEKAKVEEDKAKVKQEKVKVELERDKVEREKLKDLVQRLPCYQGEGSLPIKTKNSVEEDKRQLEEERKQLKEEMKKVETQKFKVEEEMTKVEIVKNKVEKENVKVEEVKAKVEQERVKVEEKRVQIEKMSKELQSQVECPVCLTMPRDDKPVPCCPLGHIVCSTCKDKSIRYV